MELQKRGEDEFYRAVRYRVEKMATDKRLLDIDEMPVNEWISEPNKMLSISGTGHRVIFRLNKRYQKPLL